MSFFRPRDGWDRLFTAGIFLKGLDGAVELAGGFMLLVLDTAEIHRFVVRMTQPELSEDPNDFIATHLLHAAGTLSGSAALYAALFLLAHGAVKVVLVAALLMNRLWGWAYPWMIAVLLTFIAYQLYQIAVSPTAGLVALTVFDALVVLLTWREYGRQRLRHQAQALPGVCAHSLDPSFQTPRCRVIRYPITTVVRLFLLAGPALSQVRWVSRSVLPSPRTATGGEHFSRQFLPRACFAGSSPWGRAADAHVISISAPDRAIIRGV